jgi:hypothetical protein
VRTRLAARTASAAAHLPPACRVSPAGPGSTLVVPALQRPPEGMITAMAESGRGSAEHGRAVARLMETAR